MVNGATVPYTREFYEWNRGGSFASADIVVKLVLDLVPAKSVCDLGCGVGTWLRAFREAGVADIAGFDGPWVMRDMIQIPIEHFTTTDLSKPVPAQRKFDLAVSLEVAEHLPSSAADQFVESLTTLAHVVLFSAAIPGQASVKSPNGHINEQWQSYWIEKFGARGFKVIDCIRAEIWDNPKVEYWYRQNAFIFASEEGLERNPKLKAIAEANTMPADLVHPLAFGENREPADFMGAAKLLPGLFKSAVRRKLKPKTT
jgi:SAM-dependent methyltransferase